MKRMDLSAFPASAAAMQRDRLRSWQLIVPVLAAALWGSWSIAGRVLVYRPVGTLVHDGGPPVAREVSVSVPLDGAEALRPGGRVQLRAWEGDTAEAEVVDLSVADGKWGKAISLQLDRELPAHLRAGGTRVFVVEERSPWEAVVPLARGLVAGEGSR